MRKQGPAWVLGVAWSIEFSSQDSQDLSGFGGSLARITYGALREAPTYLNAGVCWSPGLLELCNFNAIWGGLGGVYGVLQGCEKLRTHLTDRRIHT